MLVVGGESGVATGGVPRRAETGVVRGRHGELEEVAEVEEEGEEEEKEEGREEGGERGWN